MEVELISRSDASGTVGDRAEVLLCGDCDDFLRIEIGLRLAEEADPAMNVAVFFRLLI